MEKTKNQELIDFIRSLTDEQTKKILDRWDEILIKIGEVNVSRET